MSLRAALFLAAAAVSPLFAAERGADDRFQQAKRQFEQEDFTGAIWSVEQALLLNSKNPRFHNLKAAALNRQRLYEEAEGAARSSLRLAPGNPDALESLAYAQLNLGRFSEAALNAGEAVRARPGRAQPYAIRAFAHERLGEKMRALEDIRRAAALEPDLFGPDLEAALGGERMFRPERGALGARPSPTWVRGMAGAGIGAALLVAFCVWAWAVLGRDRGSRRAQADAAAPGTEELLGGKYELTRVIGKGGMGNVWEARDQSLSRPVAIKQMTEQLGALGSLARKLYLQEARTVASLRHPHIIGIYEILDLPSGVYLVFEMASGKTVQHLLAERKRLPLAETLEILRPVCDALDFAHGRGFVHRDLKPSNLMLTDQGFVKVMDFGIARRLSDEVAAAGIEARPGNGKAPAAFRMDHTRSIVGTPAYMAPEAERGGVSPVSDVFSLGVCCYEMLTGALPYRPNSGMLKVQRSYPKASDLAQGLPRGVDGLLYEALDPDPATRVPSAREFLERLERLKPAAQARG